MNFIFFSRLTREKGSDLMIEAFAQIVEEKDKLPGNLFIFSEWPQKDLLFEVFDGESCFEDCSHMTEVEIEEKLGTIWEDYKIYFFGFQPQKLVHMYLSASHFCLMPSRFLETFGLVALESLARGVPVIGYKKWGLTPFIMDDCELQVTDTVETDIEIFSDKLLEIAEKFEDETIWKQLSYKAQWIAGKYTHERWMEQVHGFLPDRTKKILLVTDYTTMLGGIETHVHNTAHLLRQHGYKVEIFWWDVGKWMFSRIYRLLGLVVSCYNFLFARALRLKIAEYKPNVIWLHSVSRFLGPLAVREVVDSRIFSCVTYHDLGIWTPFPMDTEREDEVPNSPGFWSFFISNRRRNPIALLAIPFKYLQVFFMRKYLRDIRIHLVPSSFLASYVRNLSEVPEDRIVVLEHFR